MNVNLHAILPRSRANGPGVRMVLWFQGCSLRCPGCFNPDTHPFEHRSVVAVEQLVADIASEAREMEGITITGGEPLEQKDALLELLTRVREETPLSVILFTGWTWEELQRLPECATLLSCVDVLLAGRYDCTQRLAHGLRGSANKTVHFLTGRYTLEDLESTPASEVVIGPDGDVVISGVDPVSVRAGLSEG